MVAIADPNIIIQCSFRYLETIHYQYSSANKARPFLLFFLNRNDLKYSIVYILLNHDKFNIIMSLKLRCIVRWCDRDRSKSSYSKYLSLYTVDFFKHSSYLLDQVKFLIYWTQFMVLLVKSFFDHDLILIYLTWKKFCIQYIFKIITIRRDITYYVQYIQIYVRVTFRAFE